MLYADYAYAVRKTLFYHDIPHFSFLKRGALKYFTFNEIIYT